MLHSRWSMLIVCAGLSACGGKDAAPAKAPAPAAIANPVTEGSLTTLTLTPEAVARLGIETATTAVETVSRTRSVGGEIITPPGGVGRRHRAGGRHAARGRRRSAASGHPGRARPADLHAVRDSAARSRPPRRGRRVMPPPPKPSSRSRPSARSGSSGCWPTAPPARAPLKKPARNRKWPKPMPPPREPARRRSASSPTGTGVGITVRAPIAGVVQSIAAAPGQTVAASAPLFEIVQTDALWVRVPLFVGERQRRRCRASRRR